MKGGKATLPWWPSQKWCGFGRDGRRTGTEARHVKEIGPQTQSIYYMGVPGGARMWNLCRALREGFGVFCKVSIRTAGEIAGRVGPGGTGGAVRRARAGNSRALAYTYFHD